MLLWNRQILITKMNDHELWKNIGLESEPSSPSLQSHGRHPQLRKGYNLEFDDLGSESDQQSGQLLRIKRISSPLPSEESNISQQNRSPMIITMDMEDRKEEQEQVLEAISFESSPRENQNSINKLIDNFQQQPYQKAIVSLRQSLTQREIKKRPEKNIRNTSITNKLSTVRADVAQLKQQLLAYKKYLLDVLSMWEVNAIKNCRKISNSIDHRVNQLVDSRQKTKENGMRETRELRQQNEGLHNQIRILKEELAVQKANSHKIHKQTEEIRGTLATKALEVEVNRLQASIETQHQNETFLQQQLVRAEKQLEDMKLQAEESSRQFARLKDTIKEKDNRLERQTYENDHNLKQISDLRRQLEDAHGRQRKTQMKSQLQTEQHQQEIIHYQKEISKHKQQIQKLRELLKTSQQQLRNCEGFISGFIQKSKDQEKTIEALNIKINEDKVQYYKKLQSFERVVVEIENTFQQLSKNQHHKLEELRSREIDLQQFRQNLDNRECELRQKQNEVEEIRNDLKREIFMLERKEEGMRAEYKMAVNVQNATKDKWYQRYYQLCSDREDRSKYSSSPSLTRETYTQNYHPKPSYDKIPLLQRPVRDKCSPSKNILTKAKSQFNLGIRSPKRTELGRKKIELPIPQIYRDTTITSRINNLRSQLSKELTNINSR